MDSWKSFTTSLSGAAASAAASAAPVGTQLSKQFGHLSQQARERLGAVDQTDLTELPNEYRALEARVDGLRTAHTTLTRVIKVYENEGYDCPINVQESVGGASRSLVHTIGTWTAQARGVAAPTQTDAAPPRTLAHSLSRAAAQAVVDLAHAQDQAKEHTHASTSTSVTEQDTSPKEADPTWTALPQALRSLSVALTSVGGARLAQDHAIQENFLLPWIAFGNQISITNKARQGVRDARLTLDSVKQTLKSVEASHHASGSNSTDSARVQKARSDVEHAEDVLVANTEEAIGLMKNLLENPEPVRMVGYLVKMCVLHSLFCVLALLPA